MRPSLALAALALFQTPQVGTQQPGLALAPSWATGTALPDACPAELYVRQYPALNAATVYVCDSATNTLRAPVLIQPLSGSAAFVPPVDGYLPPDPSQIPSPAAQHPRPVPPPR